MTCSITTERTDAFAVVRVTGELDLSVVPRFAAALAEARVDRRELIVDLTGVGFLDSTCLRELLGQAEIADRAGRRLKLVAPPPPAGRIFEVTGTQSRFSWVPAPGVAQTSPLPHRVARHRAALAAIGQVADDAGGLGTVARLVADATGDGCLVGRVNGRGIEPLAAAHRRADAEAGLRRLLGQPLVVTPVLAPRALGAGVFLAGEEAGRGLPPLDQVLGRGAIAALAVLPVRGDGPAAGLLGVLRDRGNPPYDEQDRVFLTGVAEVLSQTRAVAIADAGA
jgi:anti-sigma B factor antagonist